MSSSEAASRSRADANLGIWRREPGTRVRRAALLPEGAAPPFVIVAESHVPGVPTEWEPHAHPAHELVYVRRGAVTSLVGDRVFTVSEGCGLWIPAGAVHAGRLTAAAELHTAFIAPDRTPVAFESPTAIEMSPVLEALLTHLARTDIDAGARSRAEAVVFDVLEPSRPRLTLRLPGDARVDVIAEALLRDPADARSLEEWARELHVSPRTISRAFRAATGLPFAQWRASLRVHRALTLLGEGHEVQDVSERLGYAQTSTFIDAFRRLMGVTPGVYVATARTIAGRNSVSGVRKS
ncbi:helix-turn-helix transcriptional regulator [Actinomadura algeriensis]|uniref:AraC-like DNA-binding protein/mannose-6-phosphate isomerase-like protein (Cupin superfamily) n=1 Tax=Actinomadura algeriensis TaxID=1679523 RepID=A0ABR9JJW3_9ACTN|nr:AraC family transcriptional regulator [Actinomadura algeriensis]MBE1530430.1 AraC-like DNA-binding protein/mannose-6-phosphate isomerase-like protein (cupin superfamily) [Actinomadura algeriensis]